MLREPYIIQNFKYMMSSFNIAIDFEYYPQDWAINLVKYHNYVYLLLFRELNLKNVLFN